jgi:sterol desaturase/sphingolipid hydroxylase (fatty acid hydroxylase superfamily)
MLGNVAVVLAVMAVVALVETFAPFQPRRGLRTGNLLLTALVFMLNILLATSGTLLSESLRARGVGLLAGAPLRPASMFILGIVALDLATYLAHVSMHKVPALWRVHRVHHSDRLVDVTTTLRQHPLETLLRFLFVWVTTLTLGVPAAVVGVYRMTSIINGLFEHANVKLWDPLDRLLSLVVVTPNMHKIHHSRRPSETDSNYGNIVSFFDRAFSTFTAARRAGSVEYGLDEVEEGRFASLMRLPFASNG